MMVLGIVAFAVALLLSVVIHEAGHFLTAKAFGMKATQFFVGFGPTLFSRKFGETEYGVKAIPAGGFVKIVGMTPLEEVADADQQRAFFRQPTPQRVIVLAAGSVMHFVIAILLALGVAFFMPVPSSHATGIGSVGACVPVQITSATATTVPTDAANCPAGFVASPAARAGLQADDRVVAFNGTTITAPDQLTKAIRTAPGPDVTVTVLRAGKQITVPVTLARVERNLATGGAGTDPAYVLGVSVDELVSAYAAPTYSQGMHTAGTYLGCCSDQSVLFGFFGAIDGVKNTATHLFSSNRSADATSGAQVSSVYGVARISGEVLATSTVPLSVRIDDLLLIIASVNASVGILNLLPLLPFDGGHIAVTLAERWSRSRKRVGDAGKRIGRFYGRAAPAMYSVSLVIIVFSVLVLVADIRSPVA